MIKVFSTYTKDTICCINNGKKTIRNGGPAFYMENVFKKYKAKYAIFAQKAIVIINVQDGIEKGYLQGALKTKKIDNIKANDVIVISTVDNEWILENKLPHGGMMFLDAQGYIRSARRDRQIFKLDFWSMVYGMKVNVKELKEMPARIISNQKKKLLIVTKAEKGFVVYFRGKKYEFKTKKIKATDYIGAGDTFFARFILSFIKYRSNIIKSGDFATKEVTNFLLQKR